MSNRIIGYKCDTVSPNLPFRQDQLAKGEVQVMIQLTQFLQSQPYGYKYTHLELAEEIAKQETLQILQAAIREYRQQLDCAPDNLAAYPNP
jgi:hypothetical protein